MTDINKDWSRWVFASISKHFDDEKQGKPLFIEGQHRDTRDEADFLEFRMDGPYFTELSKGYWKLYIEVNILVKTTLSDTDFHDHYRSCGIAEAAFKSRIEAFRFGTGIDDDSSLLVCFKLIQNLGAKERVQTNHFGQIDPTTQVLQSTVEGHYEGFVEV